MSETERSPFPASAFSKLAAVEAQHWWFRARNNILLWALATKVRQPIHSFLEIGCGTGYVLEGVRRQYPNARLYGAEYYEEGLVFARQRVPSASFAQLDATKMTDVDRYDAVGAFDVIEHIEQDELVLSNLARALKPGGSLMVSVPQHMWLWSGADEHACHVRRYVRPELCQKVTAAGLKVVYVTSFVSLLLPLMWLMRRKAVQKAYDPVAELQLPDWQNALLERIMRLEFALLKMGLSLPAGGSLLVVAQKAA